MKLTFHGAAREVTGSCHQVEVKDANGKIRQYLFDCGMFQGEHMCGSKNKDAFAFDPSTIEAIFVSHPHADHTGRLAKIVSQGFTGTIYMVEPCVGLAKLVLEDAHHIMKEEAEKCGSEVLYEMEDVNRVFEQVKAVSYHEHLEVAPGIVVMFHEAGHVLGSSYISLDAPAVAPNGAMVGEEGKRLVYSGDIGNDNVPILPDTEPMSHADVVICESTYGHREHEPIEQRSSMLRDAIQHTIHDRGVLMIPAFSIERTQELLYEIDQLLQKDLKTKIPIFLDSPMAIRATELYRHFQNYLKFDASLIAQPDKDFFSFPNLRETLSREESKEINNTTPPMIIIAGSGMMSGGRIMHHLRRYLPDHKNRVLIIGYQAQGTLGRKIYEGAKRVKIFGDDIPVHAQVSAIGAFSAHGDMNKLTRWLRPEDGVIPKKIFLVHGDPEAKEVFATHLRHKLGTEVVIPEYQSSHEV